MGGKNGREVSKDGKPSVPHASWTSGERTWKQRTYWSSTCSYLNTDGCGMHAVLLFSLFASQIGLVLKVSGLV